MAEKRFLDQEGVKHLWSKISMEDYPNNETLMAVINAIDETKADKNLVVLKEELPNFHPIATSGNWEDLENKPFYKEINYFDTSTRYNIPLTTLSAAQSQTVSGGSIQSMRGLPYVVIFDNVWYTCSIEESSESDIYSKTIYYICNSFTNL